MTELEILKIIKKEKCTWEQATKKLKQRKKLNDFFT